jgi:hypothetical protein
MSHNPLGKLAQLSILLSNTVGLRSPVLLGVHLGLERPVLEGLFLRASRYSSVKIELLYNMATRL